MSPTTLARFRCDCLTFPEGAPFSFIATVYILVSDLVLCLLAVYVSKESLWYFSVPHVVFRIFKLSPISIDIISHYNLLKYATEITKI
jgi:hypothetical protein